MSGIFLAALIVYFIFSFRSMERSNTVYSTMGDPKLPVMFVKEQDLLINPMHAYLQDMGNQAARDSITVLPEDRKLALVMQDYDSSIQTVQYEIRSLDLSHLIENGAVTDLGTSDRKTSFTVPIQNLIAKDQEYLLKLTVDTGEDTLNFYTRILWTDQNYAVDMISLARSFTEKSFDKTAARELTQYMESNDTVDQTDLGHVTIHSSFDQITWGNTGMKPDGDFYLTVKEMSGVMGEIQIVYESECTSDQGTVTKFRNEDNYLLRYDPQRIFMMNFDRRTEELFDGSGDRFKDNSIEIGIGSEEAIQTQASDSGQFTAFTTGDALWRYDASDHGELTQIFTYRGENDSLRSDYRAHKIRVLSVQNNGDVNFLVYGYINRGKHEGYNGIVYYTYDNSEDTVTENFFIRIPENYEQIAWNVEKLSYISSGGMLYLYYEGSIYGVDINSMEVVTVAEGLEQSEFASSESGRYIAWQDPAASDRYHSSKLMFMDLDSDNNFTISQDGDNVRILGFIGEDLIYGLTEASVQDTYTTMQEVPVSRICIEDAEQNIKTDYHKDGLVFANIEVGGGRIHFDKLNAGDLSKQGEDSIISNLEGADTTKASVESENSGAKQKIYQLKVQNLGKRSVSLHTPEHLSVEKTSSIEFTADTKSSGQLFYAWSMGHFRGRTQSLREAWNLIYEDQGYVTDQNQHMIWNRDDKETIVHIKDPASKAQELIEKLPELTGLNLYEDMIMVNASGLDLNSVLYFVGKGIPVVAYSGESYQLVTGYDQFNIRLYNPGDGTEQLMGREDGENYFKDQGYHFVASVPVKN